LYPAKIILQSDIKGQKIACSGQTAGELSVSIYFSLNMERETPLFRLDDL